MEDLGRIVIDVNATGGGGAGGGQASRMLQSVGGALTKAGTGLIGEQGAVGALAAQGLTKIAAMGTAGAIAAAPLIAIGVAGIALKKTFDFLNTAAKRLTESLRDFSPDVMIADATNEILMFQEKMRASTQSGAALARRELAQGRIERAMFRVSEVVGRIGATVVAPIIEMVGNLIEVIVNKLIPALLAAAKVSSKVALKFFENLQYLNPSMAGWGIMGSTALRDISNSLNNIAANTAPMYQGNAPFIADLRLMGAKI